MQVELLLGNLRAIEAAPGAYSHPYRVRSTCVLLSRYRCFEQRE